jgi:monovalent cation/proton antiporter MnhG/PhaG subunit
MQPILEFLGAVFLFLGVAFSFLGVLGVLRLPDTYTRLHASGKTSTLGVLFLALAVAFILPSALPKLLALGIFVIFSAPVGSHAIAAAVHRGTAVQNEEAAEQGSDRVISSGVHSGEYIRQIVEQADAQRNEG